MKAKEKLISQICDGFRKYGGCASVYCFSIATVPEVVHEIVSRTRSKRPDATVLIVTGNFAMRRAIMDFFMSRDRQTTGIKCMSADYVKPQYRYANTLCVTAGVNDDFELIRKLRDENKFMLCILTKNMMDSGFIREVRSILPCIETADLDISIRADSIYSPVEEYRHGIDLDAEDRKKYDEYTEYINLSVSIFGSLENVEKCRIGDKALGISAVDCREAIARNNGWSLKLDAKVPYMRQIDDIYNPNTLEARALNFYNIAKERRDLVSDNKSKLAKILELCLENKGKRILVVSKRGEFAAKVTKCVNAAHVEGLSCGDYHDCIEDAVATDIYGNVLYSKSGANCGKPRVMRSQAQSSLNVKRFNEGIINVLSIKSASNPELAITCDLVLITSPLCDGIISIKKRFPGVVFDGVPTKVLKIYCKSTIEAEKLGKDTGNGLIRIIDDTETEVDYDEEGSVIL